MSRAIRRLIVGGAAAALAMVGVSVGQTATAAAPPTATVTTRAHAATNLSALLQPPNLADVASSGPVIPAAASFTDPTCSSSGNVVVGSYLIPTSTGVAYQVDGATTPAGKYPAANGSTITVTATAKAGFSLSGVTQWTHTFTTPKTCLGSQTGSGKTKTGTGKAKGSGKSKTGGGKSKTGTGSPKPPKPAMTGIGVPAQLLLALLLLAAGIGCHLAGSPRRPGRVRATAPEPVRRATPVPVRRATPEPVRRATPVPVRPDRTAAAASPNRNAGFGRLMRVVPDSFVRGACVLRAGRLVLTGRAPPDLRVSFRRVRVAA